MTRTYSISIDVSSVYFIGPEGRIKFFPSGIDLVSRVDSDVEPIGMASVECVETDSFLIFAFRVSAGLDFSKLMQVATSPGVLDFSASKLVFESHLKKHLTASVKSVIKRDYSVDSIVFSSIESNVSKSLSMHTFSVESSRLSEADSPDGFISLANQCEYEAAIRRKVVRASSNSIKSLIKDVRLANAVKLLYPRVSWRPAQGAEKLEDNSVCAVTGRLGIMDVCEVGERPTNPFEGSGFDEHARNHFEDWMFGDDDDDDGESVSYDEYGDPVHLSYEDNATLINIFHMLVCDNELWQKAGLDLDILEYVEDHEKNLPIELYNSLKEVVYGNCIFTEIDSLNVLWGVEVISEAREIYDFIEIVTPRRSKSRNHFFVTAFSGGVHISMMSPEYYGEEEIQENLAIYSIDCSRVVIPGAVVDSIQNLVDLVDTPETMNSAVLLIKRILENNSAHFDEVFSYV